MVGISVTQEINVPDGFTVDEFCENANNPFGTQRGIAYRTFVRKQAEAIEKKAAKTLSPSLGNPFVSFSKNYVEALNELCDGFVEPGLPLSPEPPVTTITTNKGDVLVVPSKVTSGFSIIGEGLKKETFNETIFEVIQADAVKQANVNDFVPNEFMQNFSAFSTDDEGNFDSVKGIAFIKDKLPNANKENKNIFIKEFLLKNITAEQRKADLKPISPTKAHRLFVESLAYTLGLVEKSDITSDIFADETTAKKRKLKLDPDRPQDAPEETITIEELDTSPSETPKLTRGQKAAATRKANQKKKNEELRARVAASKTSPDVVEVSPPSAPEIEPLSLSDFADDEEFDDEDEDSLPDIGPEEIEFSKSKIEIEDLDISQVDDDLDLLLDSASTTAPPKNVNIKKGAIPKANLTQGWSRLAEKWGKESIPQLASFVNDGTRRFTIGAGTFSIEQIMGKDITKFAKDNNCSFDKTDLVHILNHQRNFKAFYKGFIKDTLGSTDEKISPINKPFTKTNINAGKKEARTKIFIEQLETNLELTKNNPQSTKRCVLL